MYYTCLNHLSFLSLGTGVISAVLKASKIDSVEIAVLNVLTQ